MSHFSNHPNADSAPTEPPQRVMSNKMWKHHTPEWETMSNEEKKQWLEDNADKMEEMRMDYADGSAYTKL